MNSAAQTASNDHIATVSSLSDAQRSWLDKHGIEAVDGRGGVEYHKGLVSTLPVCAGDTFVYIEDFTRLYDGSRHLPGNEDGFDGEPKCYTVDTLKAALKILAAA